MSTWTVFTNHFFIGKSKKSMFFHSWYNEKWHDLSINLPFFTAVCLSESCEKNLCFLEAGKNIIIWVSHCVNDLSLAKTIQLISMAKNKCRSNFEKRKTANVLKLTAPSNVSVTVTKSVIILIYPKGIRFKCFHQLMKIHKNIWKTSFYVERRSFSISVSQSVCVSQLVSLCQSVCVIHYKKSSSYPFTGRE